MTPPVRSETFRAVLNLPVAGGLMLLLGLPLPAVAWLAYRQEPNLAAALLIAALGLLVGGLGLFFIVRFSGRFHLTATGIRRQRLGRETAVAFADVTRLEKHDSQLVPYLRLHTRGGHMDLTSQVVDFPRLEQLLREHLAHLQPRLPAAPPLTLRLPASHFAKNLLPLLALALFLGGLLRLTIGDAWREAAPDVLTFLGLFFGFLALVVLLDETGDPIRVELGETAVTARYLHRRRTLPAAGLRVARVRRVRTYRGFERVTYPIILTPAAGKPLRIEERRIWQYGYTPEELLAVLRSFYGSEE